MPYKPPKDLVQIHNRLCAPFGGVAEVAKFLPAKDQEYLLLFPGWVYRVSVWKPLVNLTEHGYVPDTVYTVFGPDMRYLYSERSSDGFFGRREHDVQLLSQSQHCSFVHIRFTTLVGPTMGILWIAAQKTPAEKRYQMDLWNRKAEANRRQIKEHELFFFTDCLPRRPIRSYFLPGRWNQQLLPSTIRDSENAFVQEHDPFHPIVLYPVQDGWLTFEQDGVLVVMRDARGTGVRRLRVGPACSLFTQVTNDRLSAPHPTHRDNPSRFTGSSWAGADPFMRLEATLGLAESFEIQLEHAFSPEQIPLLFLGMANENGEPGGLYERQLLQYEAFEDYSSASVTFSFAGRLLIDRVLLYDNNTLLATFMLDKPLTIEDSRILTVSLTALPHDAVPSSTSAG